MYHVQYLLSMVTRQTFHDRGARLSEQCIPWRAEGAIFILIALTKVKQRLMLECIQNYLVLPVTP